MGERLMQIPAELTANFLFLKKPMLPVLQIRFPSGEQNIAYAKPQGVKDGKVYCDLVFKDTQEHGPLVIRDVRLEDLMKGSFDTPVVINGERLVTRVEYLGQLSHEEFSWITWSRT